MNNGGKGKNAQSAKMPKDTPESPALLLGVSEMSAMAVMTPVLTIGRGSAGNAIIAVTGLVIVSTQRKVVPFLVETNSYGIALYARRPMGATMDAVRSSLGMVPDRKNLEAVQDSGSSPSGSSTGSGTSAAMRENGSSFKVSSEASNHGITADATALAQSDESTLQQKPSSIFPQAGSTTVTKQNSPRANQNNNNKGRSS